MAGFTTSTPGWDSSIRAIRSMPTTITRKASSQGHALSDPLARELRSAGRAQGSHAAKVAATVKTGTRGGVPVVTASGKPYTIGSEYGGQHRRKTYLSTSPLGRRYLVRQRRTTMQFRPFKNKGYWYTPTISGKGRAAVLKAWSKLIDDVLQEF